MEDARTRLDGTVLMLGWRAPAIAAARDLGLASAVLFTARQLDKGTVHPEEADAAEMVEDAANVEHILRGVQRLGPHPWVAVTTQEEWSTTAAGLVARHLGVGGLDPVVAALLRDKALQKRRVNAAGIRTARFIEIPDIRSVQAERDIRAFGFPSVLKPVAGAGGVATVLIEDEAAVSAALEWVLGDRYRRRHFIVEAALTGEEWHLDGWVRDGALEFLSASRYLLKGAVGDDEVPASMVVDPEREPDNHRTVTRLAIESLDALGLRTGVFHLETFVDVEQGIAFFSECSARVGGAYIYETVRAKHGVDLHRAAIALIAQQPLQQQPAEQPEVYGWTSLAAVRADVERLPALEEIQSQPGVLQCRYLPRAQGDTTPHGGQRIIHLGEAVVHAATPAGFIQRVTGLRDWFAGRVHEAQR